MKRVKRTRLVIPAGKNSLQDAVVEEYFEQISDEEFVRMFGNNPTANAAFLSGEGEVHDEHGNLKTKIILEGHLDGSNSDNGSS